MLAPKLAILPPPQLALWNMLGPAKDQGFVLYGGTAIALRLGHRQSIDFDFFTDRRLDIDALRSAMPFLLDSKALQLTGDTYTVLCEVDHPARTSRDRPVKLSFFGGIGFGRVADPEPTADHVLLVASLDDLLATKLKVLLQRVEAKDYRDIAAMLDAGVDLERGLAAASLLFGSQFQPSESLKAMTYFKGGDLDTLTKDEKRTLISAAAGAGDLPEMRKIADTLSTIQPAPIEPWKPATPEPA